ncbi:hypothetical protein LCGC14_3113500, partial [marine sediment metagenome]
MIEIILEPTVFHVEGPNPKARDKTYMINFRDGPARILLKFSPE